MIDSPDVAGCQIKFVSAKFVSKPRALAAPGWKMEAGARPRYHTPLRFSEVQSCVLTSALRARHPAEARGGSCHQTIRAGTLSPSAPRAHRPRVLWRSGVGRARRPSARSAAPLRRPSRPAAATRVPAFCARHWRSPARVRPQSGRRDPRREASTPAARCGR